MEAERAQRAWINPIGGLGDALMLSGVLAQAHGGDPGVRYNLVRRTRYTAIFRDHPAIGMIGHPPPGARIVDVAYWSREALGAGSQRPYQILARIFGLETPVKEDLFLPGEPATEPVLERLIQGARALVIVAPASDSPRKTMSAALWRTACTRVADTGALLVQVGRAEEVRLGTAMSLLGVTSPQQLAFLVRRAALVMTADNFVMHVAHMTGTPAVVIWGPTDHRVYGYPQHVHFQTGAGCPEYQACIGPGLAAHYATACPRGEEAHCVNTVDLDAVVRESIRIVSAGARAAV